MAIRDVEEIVVKKTFFTFQNLDENKHQKTPNKVTFQSVVLPVC